MRDQETDAVDAAAARSRSSPDGLGAWPFQKLPRNGWDACRWEVAICDESESAVITIAIAGSSSFDPTEDNLADLVELQSQRTLSELGPVQTLLALRNDHGHVVIQPDPT
jgi:hypothetical protein